MTDSEKPVEPPAPAAPQVLEELVQRAERAGASDIHLQMTGRTGEVSFRLDGVMTPASSLAANVADRVVGRIKYLARLKTYLESMPQDGRIDRAELGTQHDLRVATYPTVTGEKIVLRLFTEASARHLSELDLSPTVCAALEACLRRPSGLILLTGPAGSGKTTTIHACLSHVASLGGRHIITVEDPVERILPGIMQTEVCEERGLTFAKAARHLLRQDPQVLAIGEIRDEETANIVVRAALTGHLVISTLHAGSCRGVFERLLLMCPDRFAVTSAVELILNQRLLRRVCTSCSGWGCDKCLRTGYHGRVPAGEWFRVDETARQALREQGAAAISPSPTLESAAAELVRLGATLPAEWARTFGDALGNGAAAMLP